MSMVRHKRPGIAGDAGFRQQGRQSLKKGLTVLVVFKYLAPLDSSNDYVM